MVAKLPSKICILDVETAKTSFKIPEHSVLAFVGIRVYKLHKNRYYACKHKCFFASEVRELEIFLRKFRGLIIGHNIFQFDYRVLRQMVSLDGVLEKSVDTLALLYSKHGMFWGLSLDNLAKVNLGRRKSLPGKSVMKLWNQGMRKKVMKYNRNDCALTKALWWHMVSRRFVRTEYRDWDKRKPTPYSPRGDYKHSPFIIDISRKEMSCLTGKKPMLSFKSWSRKIEKDGYILAPRTKRRIAPAVPEQDEYEEDGWLPDTDPVLNPPEEE